MYAIYLVYTRVALLKQFAISSGLLSVEVHEVR